MMQEPDAAVLRLFYEATGGPGWSRADAWGGGNMSCNAFGVTCSPSGAVVALILDQNSLVGSILVHDA